MDSSCGIQAQYLWPGVRAPECTVSVVSGYVDLLLCSIWNLSSVAKDRTHAPCIAREILNYWPTREVPAGIFQM